MALRPGQIAFINCPRSDISTTGLRRVVAFVEGGGTLVTNNWR